MPQQKEGLRGQETYPKGKDEVAKARANLVKTVHIPNVQKKIAELLQGDKQKAFPVLVQMIAQIVARVITSIKGKFGSKVHVKLVMMMIKLAIDEVSLIAKGLGVEEFPKQAKMQMAQLVGDQLDQLMKKQGPGKQGMPQSGGVQRMQPTGNMGARERPAGPAGPPQQGANPNAPPQPPVQAAPQEGQGPIEEQGLLG